MTTPAYQRYQRELDAVGRTSAVRSPGEEIIHCFRDRDGLRCEVLGQHYRVYCHLSLALSAVHRRGGTPVLWGTRWS